MKVMLDLNVLLDVIQKRDSHFEASAGVLDLAVRTKIVGCTPAHALTTIHYVVMKYAGQTKADHAIDWILTHTRIAPVSRDQFLRARALPLADFEDAVVAACAISTRCAYIVTRNVGDFSRSPIPALTPEEFLALKDG